MVSVWNKLDEGLQNIYSNYLQILKEGKENVGWIHPVLKREETKLHVSLQYDGNLADIEALGFDTSQVESEGFANGYIQLENLEDVGAHPAVVQLRFGLEPKPDLDDSVIEILARKAVAGATPFIWEVNRSTGVFTGSTGEGVIIGIIDSGIDFKHKVFFKNNTPETRIIRIWDMGLKKAAGEKSPDVALLSGTKTYGVEYDDIMINKVLQNKSGAPKIRHKDCAAHGTHVAGIAAGDGRQASFLTLDGYDFVGVAPKASIIMVKALELAEDPPEADFEQRVKDAMLYIINVAKSLTQPVVINCSFGNPLGPHDGLEPFDTFVFNLFKGAKGKACIFSAGNSAGLRSDKKPKRHHAIVTMPAGGSIEIPFELDDQRTVKTEKDSCVTKSTTVGMLVQLWYKNISPKKLKASLKVPTSSTFSSTVDLGGAPATGSFDGKKSFSLSHTQEPARTSPVTGTSVIRNRISMLIQPDGDNHKSGTYTLKLEGDAGTELHVWCGGRGKQRLGIADPIPAAAAANINVTDEFTIAGEKTVPHVITVASYDHLKGTIAHDSSRGPVVDYSGSGPIAVKPDIAAPGDEITSAKSGTGEFPPELIKLMLGSFYISFGGTSMAAPHVAGLVALMLQKDKTLSVADILSKLQASARTATPLNAFGKGKIDSKKTFDAV